MTHTNGKLPEIILNDTGLYEGHLRDYFKIIFCQAKNIRHPYHNFRHMSHVLFLCFKACKFYKHNLSRRQMRNLLIAALFHDFDHSGFLGNDTLNIEKAISGLKEHILEEDKEHLADIILIIKATEYPHRIEDKKPNLCELIIRDADLSQALSVAWIQQVVIGLAEEWNLSPVEVLKNQSLFLSSLKFNTSWAKSLFPKKEIEAKLKEAEELFEIVK